MTAEPSPEEGATRAAALIDAFVQGGVRHAVISPGSRSTPLALAAASRPELALHVVVDERSAAFVALGLARISGPVIWVCTSGSAGAHAHPAVVEADRADLPLIVLTANRPAELQGVGAPQTVTQTGMFGPHARLALEIPPGPVGWIAAAVARALDAGGPVHLDVPFREPLWAPGVAFEARARPARIARGAPRIDRADLDRLAASLGDRGVIYVGHHEGKGPGDAVHRLAEVLGWPVLAEPTSGVRGLVSFEAIIRAGWPAPDFVLRFGQDPTSRAVYEWARRAETALVDPRGRVNDPHHVAGAVYAADPAWLCEALAEVVRPRAGWAAAWRAADAEATAALRGVDGFWGGAIARALADELPEDALLHVASSMAIRDLAAFGAHVRARVTANRGANGIDGTLSTAIGEALASGAPTVALLGDLAFLHDVGALALARRASVVAVVVDNGGGGIFGFLPIAVEPRFEELFLTPHGLDLLSVARGFGVDAERVGDVDALRGAVRRRLGRPGLSVVVAGIDRATDLARHRDAWTAARAALGEVS